MPVSRKSQGRRPDAAFLTEKNRPGGLFRMLVERVLEAGEGGFGAAELGDWLRRQGDEVPKGTLLREAARVGRQLATQYGTTKAGVKRAQHTVKGILEKSGGRTTYMAEASRYHLAGHESELLALIDPKSNFRKFKLKLKKKFKITNANLSEANSEAAEKRGAEPGLVAISMTKQQWEAVLAALPNAERDVSALRTARGRAAAILSVISRLDRG